MKDEEAGDGAPAEDGLAKWRTPSMLSWLANATASVGFRSASRTISGLPVTELAQPSLASNRAAERGQIALCKLLTDNNAGEVAIGMKLAPALPAPGSWWLCSLIC